MSLREDLHAVVEDIRTELGEGASYLAHLLNELERHFDLRFPQDAPKSKPALAAAAEDDDSDDEEATAPAARGRARAKA